MRSLRCLLLLCCLCALGACASDATPAPTLAPSATPTRAPVAATATPALVPSPSATRGTASSLTLLATNGNGDQLLWLDSNHGVLAQVVVGSAPWGIALARNMLAYISTAQGVALVDLQKRERLALVPYGAPSGGSSFGEYRAGGMGIAASPDGSRVYVGVYLSSGQSQLDVIDTAQRVTIASVPIGQRPFQVLLSRDGREVYTIDHDSYSVTVVDTRTLAPRTLKVAPLGLGAYDKPHYAVVRANGRLILPYQGRALIDLDPRTGAFTSTPLSANTHQHGIALTPDEQRVVIVGTGAAGSATSDAKLSIVALDSGQETLIPLRRAHEQVIVSPDGRYAFLSGGYLLGGWAGLTIVDLQTRETRELALPISPLDIALLPAESAQERDMQLIAAAKRGELAEVQRLLAQGASVHAADARGVTALIAAAYANQVDVARALIAAGADVNRQDDTRQSAYLISTSDGYLELLRLTLQHGADVHSLDSYNGTGLIRAADRGHVEIVRELLQTDIKIDHVNRLGWTALLEAIILDGGDARHTAVVRLLVDAGANVNLADRGGITPLAHARQRGFSAMVEILERAGAK